MKTLKTALSLIALALALTVGAQANTRDLFNAFNFRNVAVPFTDVNFSDDFGSGLFRYDTDANGCRKVYLYAYNPQGFVTHIQTIPTYTGGVCNPFARTSLGLYNPYDQVTTYLWLDQTQTTRFFNSSGYPNADLKWYLTTEDNNHDPGPNLYFEIVTASCCEKTVYSLYGVCYTAFPYGLGYVEAGGDWLLGQP